jgi:hypothetical protein
VTYHAHLIPIKLGKNEFEERIIKEVDSILETNKKEISDNSLILENQIDQLVYQLYDLTEEEIKIIENA